MNEYSEKDKEKRNRCAALLQNDEVLRIFMLFLTSGQ